MRAFVEERCEVGRDKAVDRSVLFFAWSEWCREHGREKHGTIEQFGRDLRAVVPTIRRSQPRKDGDSSKDGERENFYVGIGLRPVMPPKLPSILAGPGGLAQAGTGARHRSLCQIRPERDAAFRH